MWQSHSYGAGSFSFQGWLQVRRQKITEWKTWLMPAIHSFQLAHPSMRMHTHKLNYVMYEICSIEIQYNLKCLSCCNWLLLFYTFCNIEQQLLYYILDSDMIIFPSCLCFSSQSWNEAKSRKVKMTWSVQRRGRILSQTSPLLVSLPSFYAWWPAYHLWPLQAACSQSRPLQ